MKTKKFGKYIDVDYEKFVWTGKQGGLPTINWAAIGSVSPEEAERFLIELHNAIRYARIQT